MKYIIKYAHRIMVVALAVGIAAAEQAGLITMGQAGWTLGFLALWDIAGDRDERNSS